MLDGFPSPDRGANGIDVKLMRRRASWFRHQLSLKMEAFSTSLVLVERKQSACAKIDSIDQLMQITLLDTV